MEALFSPVVSDTEIEYLWKNIPTVISLHLVKAVMVAISCHSRNWMTKVFEQVVGR